MRIIYLIIGFLFLGLGFIGAFVPGLPTTVMVIISAWAFSKSSRHFESWILNHKIFGPLVRDWRKYRGLSRQAKKKAISLILITFSTTAFLVFPLMGDILFLTFGLVLCVYLGTRPEPPVLVENQL